MDYLVKRLRDCEFMGMPDARLDYSTAHEAADRIEALEAQVRAADALAEASKRLVALDADDREVIVRLEPFKNLHRSLSAYHATKKGGA